MFLNEDRVRESGVWLSREGGQLNADGSGLLEIDVLASGLGSRITGVGLAQLDALNSNIWISCLINMNVLASCIKDEKTCL